MPRRCCRALAWAFDEPFGDEAALPSLLVSELAREHVTVALAGDGGDEAFAGYERYRALRAGGDGRSRAGAASTRRAGPAGAALGPGGAALAGVPRGALSRRSRRLAADERYARLMEVFPPELRGRLWTDEARPVRYVPPAPRRRRRSRRSSSSTSRRTSQATCS